MDGLRPFPAAALARLREEMRIEWTYNSNAIEGSTLSLKETALILREGVTVAGKPLREHLEAVNHERAIERLEVLARRRADLEPETLLELHRLIMRGIDDESAGRYRSVRVRILGAVHIPPDPVKVPRLMGDLFAWYRSRRKTLEPVALAAGFHHRLASIHPFVDGNGRCSRLAMNMILIRAGYPPAVILKVDRRKYYRVLAEADQGREDALDEFVGRAVERSLILFIRALAPAGSAAYSRQGYVTLAEAAKRSPYSQEYLSLLARRGLLPAVKFGRNWMTTHDVVADHARAAHNRKTGRRARP